MEAILSGLPTSFSDKREQVVYEMATCLANSRWVAKGLFDRAVEALGHVGITDVICLMGHYTSVSMTLAFLRRTGRGDGHGALSNRARRGVQEFGCATRVRLYHLPFGNA